jgi:hypothetical protein
LGQYSATFPASAILNAQTGSITEPNQDGSYWLNTDNGPANAYIVIDLGAQYHITSFDLFNTHNANFNDRGTGDFSIEASNSIGAGPGGSVGSDLAGTVVTLLSSTLLPSADGGPIAAQSFTSSDTGSYQYIRFSPHSVATSGVPFGVNNYGLNELRVFETPLSGAPEPAPMALIASGLAMAGLLRRRFAA